MRTARAVWAGWSARRKSVVAIAVAMLVLAASAAVAGYRLVASYESGVRRIPNALPTANRPPAPAEQGVEHWLVVGSDRRADGPTTGRAAHTQQWRYGAQNADTMMLVRIKRASGGQSEVRLLSLPRDAWVSIPGHGKGKINWSLSVGGPATMVQTVERLTRVRIDHFAIVDFTGFVSVVDSLGGVEVGGRTLDGEQALAFVRERYGLAGGDLDRIRNQQRFVQAVLGKARGLLTDPIELHEVIRTVTRSVSVDDSVDLVALARTLAGVDPAGVRFQTAPVRSTGWRGRHWMLLLDRGKVRALVAAP
ncbi:LytR family transcriptional regulator [Nonomuraea sp. NN258]|uniref:LCP family protein n=1 Tax=Nonomuraea antri TaxID=2730852 RepID=UPI00156A3CF9|nr:LCP family protein [Nonomuraea antri]NRQ36366.1 LytR family transcriptional regulator [Nonomuraea antri]